MKRGGEEKRREEKRREEKRREEKRREEKLRVEGGSMSVWVLIYGALKGSMTLCLKSGKRWGRGGWGGEGGGGGRQPGAMGSRAVAMPWPGRAYLGPAGRAALPRYQYRGTDQSLFYRYLSSPGCDWITAQLPVWVAPNLITLFGFVVLL